LDNTIVRELVDAGIHFGHRVGRWNPKMKPYIFCSRNSIHIISIKETMKGLLRSQKFLANMVSTGKDVLFVGTKRQARQPIIEQAVRCGMPHVTERWLGGTLTNFSTIRKRLGRLEELESMDEKGLMAAQSKKMESMLRREMRKIKRNLDGIREMNRLPGALIIIDARREHLAVSEARKLKIPTVCLLDTDSDPDKVDIPIPGNDDAMRTIEIVAKQLAEAILEGKAAQPEPASSTTEARGPRPQSRRVSTAQAAAQISEQLSETPAAPTPAPIADAEKTDSGDSVEKTVQPE
jgi:small subunit ribosomal protein S2